MIKTGVQLCGVMCAMKDKFWIALKLVIISQQTRQNLLKCLFQAQLHLYVNTNACCLCFSLAINTRKTTGIEYPNY